MCCCTAKGDVSGAGQDDKCRQHSKITIHDRATTVQYCEIESLDNLSAFNQVIPADLIGAIAHSNLWPICSYNKFCVILQIPHFAAATHAAKLNHVALFSAIMVCPGRVPRPGNLLTQRRRRKNQ